MVVGKREILEKLDFEHTGDVYQVEFENSLFFPLRSLLYTEIKVEGVNWKAWSYFKHIDRMCRYLYIRDRKRGFKIAKRGNPHSGEISTSTFYSILFHGHFKDIAKKMRYWRHYGEEGIAECLREYMKEHQLMLPIQYYYEEIHIVNQRVYIECKIKNDRLIAEFYSEINGMEEVYHEQVRAGRKVSEVMKFRLMTISEFRKIMPIQKFREIREGI